MHLYQRYFGIYQRKCDALWRNRGGQQVSDSENIYIEGDNLDALKLLQETYLGKVKMIHIDESVTEMIQTA